MTDAIERGPAMQEVNKSADMSIQGDDDIDNELAALCGFFAQDDVDNELSAFFNFDDVLGGAMAVDEHSASGAVSSPAAELNSLFGDLDAAFELPDLDFESILAGNDFTPAAACDGEETEQVNAAGPANAEEVHDDIGGLNAEAKKPVMYLPAITEEANKVGIEKNEQFPKMKQQEKPPSAKTGPQLEVSKTQDTEAKEASSADAEDNSSLPRSRKRSPTTPTETCSEKRAKTGLSNSTSQAVMPPPYKKPDPNAPPELRVIKPIPKPPRPSPPVRMTTRSQGLRFASGLQVSPPPTTSSSSSRRSSISTSSAPLQIETNGSGKKGSVDQWKSKAKAKTRSQSMQSTSSSNFSEATSEATSRGSRKSRKKAGHSCTPCKLAKQPCDGVKPYTCGRCLSRSSPCEYTESKRKVNKKRGKQPHTESWLRSQYQIESEMAPVHTHVRESMLLQLRAEYNSGFRDRNLPSWVFEFLYPGRYPQWTELVKCTDPLTIQDLFNYLMATGIDPVSSIPKPGEEDESVAAAAEAEAALRESGSQSQPQIDSEQRCVLIEDREKLAKNGWPSSGASASTPLDLTEED